MVPTEYAIFCLINGVPTCKRAFTLKDALAECEQLRRDAAQGAAVVRFITMVSENVDSVTKLGVDEIKDGLCPDGVPYDWVKRRVADTKAIEQKVNIDDRQVMNFWSVPQDLVASFQKLSNGRGINKFIWRLSGGFYTPTTSIELLQEAVEGALIATFMRITALKKGSRPAELKIKYADEILLKLELSRRLPRVDLADARALSIRMLRALKESLIGKVLLIDGGQVHLENGLIVIKSNTLSS